MPVPVNIDMIPVASSNVKAIGYDRDFRRLYVSFKSGDVYRYEDVPEFTFQTFLIAPSKGKYLYDVIRAGGTDSLYAYAKL
jgi:hypothetical protein